MYKAHRITPDNVDRLKSIYERFSAKAKKEYRWSYDPVGFPVLVDAVAAGLMEGLWLEDTSQPIDAGQGKAVAFMLYCLEAHRAIEINLLYSESDDRKTVLDRLIRLFIEENRNRDSWDVVSFAMLGEQERFIRTITWYGFKPVGQAILKFSFMDTIALQILQQQQPEPLGPEYAIDSWKPEYAAGTAQSIYEAFEKSADARWDPRFRTLEGATQVVEMITTGVMGAHIPGCTTVLLKDGEPVGFCFLIQASPTGGNIPLIGVRPSEKRKGLGSHLLKGMLERAIQAIMAGQVNMVEISTTMDTDNIPAIKMYRRMGFKEEYNYPHVYLSREAMQRYKPGQWC